MRTFIRETLGLLEVALCYPVKVAIYGTAKARRLSNEQIDRVLGVK